MKPKGRCSCVASHQRQGGARHPVPLLQPGAPSRAFQARGRGGVQMQGKQTEAESPTLVPPAEPGPSSPGSSAGEPPPRPALGRGRPRSCHGVPAKPPGPSGQRTRREDSEERRGRVPTRPLRGCGTAVSRPQGPETAGGAKCGGLDVVSDRGKYTRHEICCLNHLKGSRPHHPSPELTSPN